MTIRRPKNAARYITEPLEAELRKLRLQVEKLQDQVRKERRRADQHADEVACLRRQQVYEARRRLNGEYR